MVTSIPFRLADNRQVLIGWLCSLPNRSKESNRQRRDQFLKSDPRLIDVLLDNKRCNSDRPIAGYSPEPPFPYPCLTGKVLFPASFMRRKKPRSSNEVRGSSSIVKIGQGLNAATANNKTKPTKSQGNQSAGFGDCKQVGTEIDLIGTRCSC